MDGDDDLFAVFDADEGGDKPSKILPSSASDERQVSSPVSLIMHACMYFSSDGWCKSGGRDLWNQETAPRKV